MAAGARQPVRGGGSASVTVTIADGRTPSLASAPAHGPCMASPDHTLWSPKRVAGPAKIATMASATTSHAWIRHAASAGSRKTTGANDDGRAADHDPGVRLHDSVSGSSVPSSAALPCATAAAKPFAASFSIFGHGSVAGSAALLEDEARLRCVPARNGGDRPRRRLAQAAGPAATSACTPSSVRAQRPDMVTSTRSPTVNRSVLAARQRLAHTPARSSCRLERRRAPDVGRRHVPAVCRFRHVVQRPRARLRALPWRVRVAADPADVGPPGRRLPNVPTRGASRFQRALISPRRWVVRARASPDDAHAAGSQSGARRRQRH